MRTCKQDNHLLGRGQVVPFPLVVMTGGLFAVVCILLWYIALDPQANQTGPLLHLTALGATVLTIFGIPQLVENYHFSRLRWQIEPDRILLENKKERYVFNLRQDYLVTRYTFRLSMGKATTCAPMFCLLRPDNSHRFRDNGGIGPMKKFLKSGGILLPRQALSELMDATGLEHIPEYPRTASCKGK